MRFTVSAEKGAQVYQIPVLWVELHPSKRFVNCPKPWEVTLRVTEVSVSVNVTLFGNWASADVIK